VTYDDGSVLRTIDDGANWANVTPPIASPAPARAAAPPDEDPTGGDEIEDGDDEDGGREEFDLSGPGNGNLIIDPTDPLTIYLVRGFYGGAHVLRTTDGGAHWADISANLPDAPTSAIAIDPRTPTHTLYVGNTVGVFISTDAGAHWTRFGAGLPNADVTSLELSTAGNFLTAGTYGRGAWQVALTAASIGALGATVAPGQNVQLSPMGAQHYPTLTASRFDYSIRSHQLQFTFSKPMSPSLSAASFDVRPIGSIAPLSPAFAYDPTTRTVTLTFANPLPDARYRVTISGTSTTDDADNPLDGNADGTPGDNVTFDFFYMTADANHDGAVDFKDLVALAQNYNTTQKTFAQGDLNYDTNVDFNDLVILAQRYNTTLPAAPAPAKVPQAIAIGPAPTAPVKTVTRRNDKPIFSVLPVARPTPKPKPKPKPRAIT
jgi:hypothetical protein